MPGLSRAASGRGGLVIDYVLQAWAPSLGWLFLGRLIAGLCGASIVIANACLADVSTPETRARAFGFMVLDAGAGLIAVAAMRSR